MVRWGRCIDLLQGAGAAVLLAIVGVVSAAEGSGGSGDGRQPAESQGNPADADDNSDKTLALWAKLGPLLGLIGVGLVAAFFPAKICHKPQNTVQPEAHKEEEMVEMSGIQRLESLIEAAQDREQREASLNAAQTLNADLTAKEDWLQNQAADSIQGNYTSSVFAVPRFIRRVQMATASSAAPDRREPEPPHPGSTAAPPPSSTEPADDFDL